ncbi:hypothetical protein [Bradyrhizobium sp. RDT46]|uniref:hypothetical protein n=1 Tax=Bradyrhizobium sp. RDT46 TaxID=3341829 RepID=UPI0035C74425
MTPPPAASLSDRRDFEMTKKTFSGEIDRFGMTRIHFTLPGSEPHAAATEQHYEPRQTCELRRIKVGTALAMRPSQPGWADLRKIRSSALHFGSATI